MSVGELQVCNLAINGCVRRSFFVFFSYSFKEATKMACSGAEEEPVEAMGGDWDIVATAVRGASEGEKVAG
jgi:hypothetical protein